MYEIKPSEYKKILKDNKTKTYKKVPTRSEKVVNYKAEKIAKNFKLDDWIECIPENTAFVTKKDHHQISYTMPFKKNYENWNLVKYVK